MRTASSPPGVFVAAYDLCARVYLEGPRALAPGRVAGLDALLTALGTLDPRWPAAVRSLIACDTTDPEAAGRAFLARMATPARGCYVPPYASVYLDGGTLWGPSTFEVLSWYEAERLAWDRERPGPGGSRITAPDHVGVEMAFLAVVSARPDASQPGARAARLRAALAHSGAWLPQFQQALEQAGAPGGATTLPAWTALAAQIVKADLRRRTGRPGVDAAAPPVPVRRHGRATRRR